KKGRPPSLSSIYVPQTTIPPAAADGEGLTPDRDADAPRRGREEGRERPTLTLNRLGPGALDVSRGPGTGEATVCRRVACLVAEGAIPSDVALPEAFTEVLDGGLKDRLPLLVRLRELWDYVPRSGTSLTAAELVEALSRWIDRKQPDGLDVGLVRAHLE